jgi:cobalamin synthase
VFPALVVAALVVGADLVLTGLLHMDGLVDSADGLLPHLGRERRLEVMSAPTVGAFGISVAGLFIVVRFAAVASLVPAGAARSALLFAGIWCTSRSIMILGAVVLPYARAGENHGLAAAFLPDDEASLRLTVTAGVLGLGASAAALGWWRPVGGLAAFGAALLGGALVLLLARRRIGGFTGDVLGAAGVVAETVGLIVAAAKW